MNVTMQDVLNVLEPDEPRYSEVAALGPDSLPHLRKLVEGDDPMLASKAAYAASLLEGDEGQEVVLAAAHSDAVIVRAAAAGGARNLSTESAATVLTDLVGDADASVRKVARSAVPDDAPQALLDKVNAAAEEGGPASSGEQSVEGLMPREASGAGLMPGEIPNAGLMPGEEPPPRNADRTGTNSMPN